MYLLPDMVSCGSSRTRRSVKFLSEFSEQAQESLKSVTQMQRRKYERYGLVPVPVLEAMWHLGWLPGDKAPNHGMRILALTEYLRQGLYKSAQAADRGNWLYHLIMKEEVMARRPVVKKERFPAVDIRY